MPRFAATLIRNARDYGLTNLLRRVRAIDLVYWSVPLLQLATVAVVVLAFVVGNALFDFMGPAAFALSGVLVCVPATVFACSTICAVTYFALLPFAAPWKDPHWWPWEVVYPAASILVGVFGVTAILL